MTQRSPRLPPRVGLIKIMDADSTYEEIGALPMPISPSKPRPMVPIDMAQKLDSILQTVRNIDKNIKVLNQPVRPPKTFEVPKKEAPKEPDLSVEFLELPPPRPPREKGAAVEDKSKKFSASQCEFLVTQLRSVRAFVDENFEDEFVDKDDNMIALNTAIRALCGF